MLAAGSGFALPSKTRKDRIDIIDKLTCFFLPAIGAAGSIVAAVFVS